MVRSDFLEYIYIKSSGCNVINYDRVKINIFDIIILNTNLSKVLLHLYIYSNNFTNL